MNAAALGKGGDARGGEASGPAFTVRKNVCIHIHSGMVECLNNRVDFVVYLNVFFIKGFFKLN